LFDADLNMLFQFPGILLLTYFYLVLSIDPFSFYLLYVMLMRTGCAPSVCVRLPDMSSGDKPFCGICMNIIEETIDVITCSICYGVYHSECCNQGVEAPYDIVNWLCINCIAEVFPFVENDEEFIQNDFIRTDETAAIGLNDEATAIGLNDVNLEIVVFPEESGNRILLNNTDTDPDLNYFSNIAWNSPYSTLNSWENKFELIGSNFSIMHVNCRSMTHKLGEIRDILSLLPVTILALSETWLEPGLEDTINIPGFTFLHKSRGECRGGGVGMFIRDSIKYQLYDVKRLHKTYEGLFIKTYLSNTTCVVGVLYRPPGQNLIEFNIEIDDLLSSITRGTQTMMLLGDFNIDLLKINEHKETNLFYNCLTSHQLIPAITRPTRITPDSSTLIDNIFTNAWPKLIESTIIISDLSDHLPVLACFAFNNSKKRTLNSYDHRIVNEERLEQFKTLLADSDWDPVMTTSKEGDANGAYELFLNIYKNAYDKAFPLASKKSNSNVPKFKQPWMTTGLLKSSKKKASLYLKYLKNPNILNKNKFTEYRNKFKTIRIKAEKSYYAAEFCKYKDDLRKTWKLIRSIMQLENREAQIESLNINGKNVNDAKEMANGFNSYFTNIAHSLAEKIPDPPLPYSSYLQAPLQNSMGLLSVSPEEIMDISRNIRLTHSKGIDDIDPCIASPNLSLVAKPLAEIINCSFTTGIVPQAIKIAKVVPILKKGEKDNVTNYRPISVLPYFSKFYEKLMYNRLYGFVKNSNIIYQSQHGFQPGHSPYMALLNMQDKISKAIENNEYSVGVFFDLAKAFDTVDHDILLNKLENYGIRGTQLKWFASYFENRAQRVFCNGTLSELGLIKYGVPQGSNLGPLLFLLYINDLASVSPTLFFILFADDTNVFYSNGSWQTLIQIVNFELSTIAAWFQANKLTLNLEKTNFILFKSHRKINPSGNLSLFINDSPITQVESTKFLGVHIDQHMTWKVHINQITAKIAKNVGILTRIAYILPKEIRINLYYTLIYPYLTYCNLIWASTYESRLHKLVILQKRAVRIIAGIRKWEHTGPSFSEFKLLKIHQIKDLQIGEFFFRLEHGLLPPVFKDFLSHASDIHTHFTRNLTAYRPIKAHSNTRRFTIKSYGTLVWNALPIEIRSSSNLQVFKKRLRAFFLSSI